VQREFAAAQPALGTIGGMAYDEQLAGRIRQPIGTDPELTKKKMFGGLAFLIHMAIAASSEGGAMVRVDPAQSDTLVATKNATPVNTRGRDMPGWLRVSSDDLRPTTSSPPGSKSAPGTHARCRPSRSPLERAQHRPGHLDRLDAQVCSRRLGGIDGDRSCEGVQAARSTRGKRRG
jgi:hypothetical protein